MSITPTRRIAALLSAIAASLPAATLAAPGDWLYDYDRNASPPARVQAPPPVRGSWAYGPGGGTPSQPLDPAQNEALMAQRCNIGRLVGGIVGGGIGYGASRQDGRSWAVPLGALLGQQMGCSIGAGRGPRPW
ncbi:MAG: hypothetical protein ACK522_08740 [Synechococcaceae cyanobacterium]|jgi:hypothetical protein